VLRNRAAAIWIAVVALLLLGSAAYYYAVPYQHAQWCAWHQRAWRSIRNGYAGRDTAIPPGVPAGMSEMLPLYERGAKLATERGRTYNMLVTQSFETIKVIGTVNRVLASGNTVGLDAMRQPLKAMLDKQFGLRQQYLRADRDWQVWLGVLKEKWDAKNTPGLDFGLPGGGVVISSELLTQARQVEQELSALQHEATEAHLEFAGKLPNLTPYEADKQKVVEAKLILYYRLQDALGSAFQALHIARTAKESLANTGQTQNPSLGADIAKAVDEVASGLRQAEAEH